MLWLQIVEIGKCRICKLCST